jgi:hypothetical protein
MTLIKSRREHITILDFSNGELSKNMIKQSLRKTKIANASKENKKTFTVFDSYIKVGMYDIKLVFQEDDSVKKPTQPLREFGKFQISIIESNKEINLHSDKRFKGQIWLKDNKNSNLRINSLIEAIYHCYRLNKLKLFL